MPAEHGCFLPVVSKDNRLVFEIGAVLDAMFTAEPAQRALNFIFERYASRVIGVEHGKIAGLLVFKYPRLRVDVSLKRMVPVEMIRRDVQDGGDPGAKLFDGLQLEARDLKDGDRIRGGPRSKRDHARSHITAHACFFAVRSSTGVRT